MRRTAYTANRNVNPRTVVPPKSGTAVLVPRTTVKLTNVTPVGGTPLPAKASSVRDALESTHIPITHDGSGGWTCKCLIGTRSLVLRSFVSVRDVRAYSGGYWVGVIYIEGTELQVRPS